MSENAGDIGIASIGVYLPEGREGAEEIAARSGLSVQDVVGVLGIESKCSPTVEEQPVRMAVEAARKALSRAPGIAAGDIDVVLWTGEEYKDYVAQTAAIRLQEEIGARNAWAFDLVGQGVTSLVGLRVARALMQSDPSVGTVLLAGGSRNVDLVDYRNDATRFLLSTGASGAAILLRRGHGRNRLCGVALRVDPDLADDVCVPGGGTVHPFTKENLATPLMRFQVARPQVVSDYVERTMPQRIIETVHAALAEARLDSRPPDYLALRHLAPAASARVLDALRVRPGGTDGLADVGHSGPNDPIISLERGLERGQVRDGSTVVLAAAGIGFTYAAAVVAWGTA